MNASDFHYLNHIFLPYVSFFSKLICSADVNSFDNKFYLLVFCFVSGKLGRSIGFEW